MACAPATELIVVVDAPAGDSVRFDGLTVEVSTAGGATQRSEGALTGPGGRPLPRTLGIVPGNADATLVITASGTLAGNPVVTQRARVRFVAGERRVLRLELSSDCAASACATAAEQTCVESRCRCDGVPSERLAPWDGALPPRGLRVAHLDGAIDPPPRYPLRAAYYDARYPVGWTQDGRFPASNYHPTRDPSGYSSSDCATVRAHIATMQRAHIAAGLVTWDDPGDRADLAMPVLLSAAAGTGFRWAISQHGEYRDNPDAAELARQLAYIRDHYADDPAYLRIDGRFVVFVASGPSDVPSPPPSAWNPCQLPERWAMAVAQDTAMHPDAMRPYLVIKRATGANNCPHEPDAWYQRANGLGGAESLPDSYGINPGACPFTDPIASCPPRNLAAFQRDVMNMARSPTRFHLVFTFNEWDEGSAVESANEWATASGDGAYLDALAAVPEPGVAP